MKHLIFLISVLLLLYEIQPSEAIINWAGNTWASGCDFIGNNLLMANNTRFEECEPLCIDTTDCSHYSWSNNVCTLKQGTVYESDAVETNIGTKCGYLKTFATASQCVNMWDVTEKDYHDPTANLKLCPVYGNSANPQICTFPFNYQGKTNNRCFNTGSSLVCQVPTGTNHIIADCIGNWGLSFYLWLILRPDIYTENF